MNEELGEVEMDEIGYSIRRLLTCIKTGSYSPKHFNEIQSAVTMAECILRAYFPEKPQRS